MTHLKSLLFACLGLLLLAPAGPSFAEDRGVGEAERQAVRQVIESQLAAFQRDDGAEAFSYAAPGIQRMFGTPEVFMQMVRSGYRPVYRPREFEFRTLERSGTRLRQEVLFVGPDGEPVIALYAMEQQPDGSWRIAGVVLVKAPDETV